VSEKDQVIPRTAVICTVALVGVLDFSAVVEPSKKAQFRSIGKRRNANICLLLGVPKEALVEGHFITSSGWVFRQHRSLDAAFYSICELAGYRFGILP
jgi:hypothetical protein